MQTIRGKYASAVVYADTIEPEALQQIYDCCNSVGYEGEPIRIMPDCHVGKNSVIGFSCPVGKYVNPNVVGVDIGCTISAHRLSKPLSRENFPLFEHRLKQTVPTGFSVNEHPVVDDKRLYRFLTAAYDKARAAAPEWINDVGGRIDERYMASMLKRIGMDFALWKKSLCSVGGGEQDCHRYS